ncbi:uncharacterized protein LOC116822896 isoform X2 [Chelonoidis abingdonii]|uniref:uncharacterized protein LOC116822896 isoform X2 n=1 Tax=Chelonoidis abingdonii TaxID=106734 RepID=UPI003F491C36
MGTRGGMASREKAGQMKPKASPQEKVRTNLLQLMLGRQAPTTKKDTKLLLHRMVFLAKISPELADKQDLAGLQRGALLHPEGPARHAGPAAQQWSYKVLAVPSRHLGYDTSREEPIETITGECLAMLLKLGMHLLKYPKSPLNLPDAVLEEVSNLIIPQDTIYHLLECRELLSPAQFLQAYDSPLNVVMDSGHMFGSDNPYAVARVASAWEGEAGRCELVNEKDLGPMDAWGMAEIGGVQATAQALLQPTAGHAVLRAWLISAHDRGEHPRAARESGQRSLRLTSGMMGSDGQMGLTVIIWGLTSHWLSACDTRTALTELWYCRERERERERESVCVCV